MNCVQNLFSFLTPSVRLYDFIIQTLTHVYANQNGLFIWINKGVNCHHSCIVTYLKGKFGCAHIHIQAECTYTEVPM